MKSVSKRNARRKQQKQAKKIQRKIPKRKKNHSIGKRLTWSFEKKIRKK
jgi:hypothetical protein